MWTENGIDLGKAGIRTENGHQRERARRLGGRDDHQARYPSGGHCSGARSGRAHFKVRSRVSTWSLSSPWSCSLASALVVFILIGASVVALQEAYQPRRMARRHAHIRRLTRVRTCKYRSPGWSVFTRRYTWCRGTERDYCATPFPSGATNKVSPSLWRTRTRQPASIGGLSSAITARHSSARTCT